jgi:hypothetical protein
MIVLPRKRETQRKETIMWNTDQKTDAILKVQDGINPAAPAGHWCYDGTDALYVVKRDNGRLIVIRSCGSMGAEYAVGTYHEFHADQSGRSLGGGTVVGSNVAGVIAGEVPSRKTVYYVFK